MENGSTDSITPQRLPAPPMRIQFSLSSYGRSEPPSGSKFTIESVELQNFQLKPIYEWLCRIDLPQVYDLFVSAGYEHIETLRLAMLSSCPVTDSTLKGMGIFRVGHRMKILLYLNEDMGMPRCPVKTSGSMICCSRAENLTETSVSLLSWLEQLKLESLYPLFEASGFDDYEALLEFMQSDTPLTEEILRNEVKVPEPADRARVLYKLGEDIKRTSSFSCSICEIV